MSRILAIDDEPAAIDIYRRALSSEGHDIVAAGSCEEGLTRAGDGGIDAIILDYQLPDGEGIDLIPRLATAAEGVPIIMATSHGSTARAVRAIREGAYDFIEKPFSIDVLRVSVANAISFSALARRAAWERDNSLKKYRGGEDPFGDLPQATADVLRKAAPTKATI